ncbi:MAG: pantoate--beta-alanine ligase [Alphaproteobacteria bacterium]|nr:pantoate--beta-alanine ligase [Alphaproteobacteria bacterium]
MSGSFAESTLATVRSKSDLRARVAAWRAAGETVALVPTMGALHVGHGALVEAARGAADRVVASLFVNPTQFGPREDFAAYPRDEAADAAFLARVRADLLYAPTVAEMYPDGFATAVRVAGLGDVLCGAVRPGHFDGVATVVVKLLTQAAPDFAFFGEKDYQQLVIIRRVAADLDLPVRIEGVATVRDADGLAVSSRNAYLDAAQRAIAPALQGVLRAAAQRIAEGVDISDACEDGKAALIAAGFDKVDYCACVDPETLQPLAEATGPARLLAAAHLGRARLIDNIALKL